MASSKATALKQLRVTFIVKPVSLKAKKGFSSQYGCPSFFHITT